MLGKKEAIPEKKAETGALGSWHQPVPWLVMNHHSRGRLQTVQMVTKELS